MRARISFRGLTLFTFDKPTANAKPCDNLGTLTAWLLSDPTHLGMPLHTHKPRMSFIGRDLGSDVGRVETNLWVPADTKIELVGHQLPVGVTVDGSFLDYVPRLGALKYGDARSREQVLESLKGSRYVTCRVVIPSGTIRAREFITWDWYGNTPGRVAYMDTNFHGFGANEVVVDIGDDSDMPSDDKRKCLKVTGHGASSVQLKYQPPTAGRYEFNASLWPRAKTPLDDDVYPNYVDLSFLNTPAKRSRSVFWGIHAMTHFDAAGYERLKDYKNVDQYQSFLAAANAYDAEQWASDRDSMGTGHPFPFLIDPGCERLSGLANGAKPALATVPPIPHIRPRLDHPTGGAGGSKRHTGHDPDHTEICPHMYE